MRWRQAQETESVIAAFLAEALMGWCESNEVDFILGLAKSSRLKARIAGQMERSRRRCLARGKPSRRYRGFRFRTLRSWSRSRQVVGKAEWLPGSNGSNPRFDRVPSRGVRAWCRSR